MVLILLDLGNDFGNLPPFAEVNQVRVGQAVGIALSEEYDVGLEEGRSTVVLKLKRLRH